MKVINEVHEKAVIAKFLNRNSQISNCLVLGKKLLKFDVRLLKKKIDVSLRKFVKFFNTSYKGFYCTICDSENHKYFNLMDRSIQFS